LKNSNGLVDIYEALAAIFIFSSGDFEEKIKG